MKGSQVKNTTVQNIIKLIDAISTVIFIKYVYYLGVFSVHPSSASPCFRWENHSFEPAGYFVTLDNNYCIIRYFEWFSKSKCYPSGNASTN